MVLVSACKETDFQLLAWSVSRAWMRPTVYVQIPTGKEQRLRSATAWAWGIAAVCLCRSPCLWNGSSLAAVHMLSLRRQWELILSTSFLEKDDPSHKNWTSWEILRAIAGICYERGLCHEPPSVVWWSSLQRPDDFSCADCGRQELLIFPQSLLFFTRSG